MATVTIDLVCNLQQAVQVQYLNGNMFSADNAGNTINVYVMDGEEPATIGGSVSASVIRADGSTVAVSGALEGNRAYVILPQACYAVPGVISIVIKNTQNSTVTTIAALVANVYQSSTDVVVDPGTIIPSVQNLIAAIDAAVGSIPADYSSLWTSLAPAFSTSTAYTVGQYVTNNGGLYRFIADHAAGTWNSAQVVAANLGNDLSALKSAFDPNNAVNLLAFVNRSDTLTGITYSYSNGEMSISGTATANTACKILVDDESGYGVDLPSGVNAGDTLYVKTSGLSSAVRLNITFYNGTTSVGTNWYISDNGTTLVTVPSTANKIRVRIYVTNGTIIPSGTVLGISITNSMTNKEIGANFVRSAEMANYIANAKILASGDLNEISGNMCGILISANTYTHAPFTIGTIINFDFSATLSVQFGYQFSSGNMFYRRKSTTWGDWIAITPEIPYKTTGKYVAFGDSLTYGAVWSPTSGTSLHRVKTEWQIPTRIALATGMIENFVNEAIGGIGYLKLESGENLVSLIGDYSFDGVELVTIMAGANDKSGFNLGTSADSASENTICGAIRNIIQTIAEKNPKTQIIIIQPTPSGVDGSTQDVWSTIPSGWKWSMNQFDEQVSQLCHDEHVGYLNWWDSTYCRNWTCKGYNGSVGPNYTHPTVDDDYYLLGNFIAGKVASLFHGLN